MKKATKKKATKRANDIVLTSVKLDKKHLTKLNKLAKEHDLRGRSAAIRHCIENH